MKVLVRQMAKRHAYIYDYYQNRNETESRPSLIRLLVDTYLWEKQFLGVSCFDRLY